MELFNFNESLLDFYGSDDVDDIDDAGAPASNMSSTSSNSDSSGQENSSTNNGTSNQSTSQPSSAPPAPNASNEQSDSVAGTNSGADKINSMVVTNTTVNKKIVYRNHQQFENVTEQEVVVKNVKVENKYNVNYHEQRNDYNIDEYNNYGKTLISGDAAREAICINAERKRDWKEQMIESIAWTTSWIFEAPAGYIASRFIRGRNNAHVGRTNAAEFDSRMNIDFVLNKKGKIPVDHLDLHAKPVGIDLSNNSDVSIMEVSVKVKEQFSTAEINKMLGFKRNTSATITMKAAGGIGGRAHGFWKGKRESDVLRLRFPVIKLCRISVTPAGKDNEKRRYMNAVDEDSGYFLKLYFKYKPSQIQHLPVEGNGFLKDPEELIKKVL